MYHLCSLFQFIQFPLYNVIITSQSYELLVSAFYLLFLVVFFISTLIYHQILPIFLSFFLSSLPFLSLPFMGAPERRKKGGKELIRANRVNARKKMQERPNREG